MHASTGLQCNPFCFFVLAFSFNLNDTLYLSFSFVEFLLHIIWMQFQKYMAAEN